MMHQETRPLPLRAEASQLNRLQLNPPSAELQGMATAWRTWRAFAATRMHQQRVVAAALRRLVASQLAMAFARWYEVSTTSPSSEPET